MIQKFTGIAVAAFITSLTLTSCGSKVPTMDGSSVSVTGASTEADILSEPDASAISDTVVIVSEEAEQFSINVSIPDNYTIPDSFILEGFNTVLQEPELPTGCEITTLAEVLNYHGFNIDKEELCDNFMPVDYVGSVTMTQAYLGDPRSNNGFGCYSPVIVKSAYEYFESIDSPCYAVDLSGTDFRDLFYQICQGRPVIVWATMYLTESYPNYKWTAGNGKDMIFNDYQHCMAIYGYDLNEGIIYAGDPLVGNTTYSIDRFEMIYDIMYKQAVVICGDSETEGNFTPDPEIENNDVWSRKKQLIEENSVDSGYEFTDVNVADAYMEE
ncbi:MAG: C39 family peptidase [Ruminococcus flavefaciens]|nr:C39 family peptidase [Ruminococcus flavefaciens]MCM1362665.1 C39 family peptidase [Clostridiales bacterium]MCM1435056.1 C39 family peptidase [Ruminococcus flavefaciens]